MGKRERDDEDEGPSTSGPNSTIGQKTSFIKNKIVRSEKYAKLRHEKTKLKRKERAKRQKEIEKAEGLGEEPPPKPVPKASSVCVRA
jgi:ribosome production factor 1